MPKIRNFLVIDPLLRGKPKLDKVFAQGEIRISLYTTILLLTLRCEDHVNDVVLDVFFIRYTMCRFLLVLGHMAIV